MRILLLADTGHHTQAVSDHINALTQYSSHEWHVENPLTCKILHRLDLAYFDAIGIHYSIKAYSDYYLPRALRLALIHYKGIKFILIQDEYHSVQFNINAMAELGISLLLTLVKPEYHRLAYADPVMDRITIKTVLTGYVSEELKHVQALPLNMRQTDIFYRTREYPYWLGQLAYQRIEIAEGVKQRAQDYSLRVDISTAEADRLYGKKWLNALAQAKSVLGTESGASLWDVTGEIRRQTEHYIAHHPKDGFYKVSAAVFQQQEGLVPYATISPRFFEAAAVKTPLILFPGDYEGILKPGIHYIECQRDFANFASVVKQLKDLDFLEQITNQTYQDLVLSNRFSAVHLAQTVDQALLEQHQNAETPIYADAAIISTTTLFQRQASLKWLNKLYCLLAEVRFMWKQFTLLLADERYRGFGKIKLLYRGAHRYSVYIWARLTRKKRTNLKSTDHQGITR